ncbi:acetyl-CoA C-acetyltransferase [Pluralibacter gergoviae]|uniref:acetyl-CoA C-acetyltransferase n=1 Tax=Pluralibacter gergoviae TaxID=61647 RepID=UPI000A380C46|nr:acetyl-CoA C-acetyltransferase [Pluralibacter gergoviae]OUF43006.1 hypothetical protein AZ034_003657 [Pluralibacter gergoviae]OUF54777.1 hypothetical protein AZ044_001014 [Pluralibacter gergoviae]
MNKVAIVAATRTAIGSFQGALSPLPATALGAAVIKALLERTGIDPAAVSSVLMGQVLTAGCGQNPARQSAIQAGLPVTTPAVTLNLVCGSGLQAIIEGARAVALGDADVVIAGGQESMSNAPYLMPGARAGLRAGHKQLKDSMIQDGLWDAFNDYHMGITAENLASRFNISREQQDAFALASQQKAAAALEAGRFGDEITPLSVPAGRGKTRTVDTDEQPRTDTTAETLAALRPAFIPGTGTVTAGNASTLNDGAAAVMLMSEARAAELNLPVLATIAGYATAGVEPEIMGFGPVPATLACLNKAGWTISDLELVEGNEAFAVQALVVLQALELNPDIVNVNGGAIALGHPIGASGCRILVSLLYEMQRRGAAKGLATLCVGGGQGVALAVERPGGE